jgi:ATP-binding cassette subfamily B protein
MPDSSGMASSPHLTALRSLFVVALHRGVRLTPETLGSISESDTIGSVLEAMRKVRLRGKVLRNCAWADIAGLGGAYPLMASMKDGFWVVVVNVSQGADGPVAAVLDPLSEKDGIALVPQAEFVRRWTGTLLLCRNARRSAEDPNAFGLGWFVPEIMRHRAVLRDVAVAAIMSSLIAFATPLMFQVLIDKVVAHQSRQTLVAVVLLFGICLLFDTVFGYARQYLMLFVTSKVDARLASRVFQHLLTLPLSFFEGTTAGVVLRHLQQTDTIRQFLTGRLFQTLLDAIALPILLVILALYSPGLTAVVLLFSAAIAGVIGVLIPSFRKRLERLYAAEGQRQSHLVETIHGMRTVKSLAVEPIRMSAWDEKVAAGIRERAAVGRISAVAHTLTQALEKTMQITVLALGTSSVFDGSLSIGALVAFTMISGRVSGPLVQIVGLISEYQETSLAVKMLGTVMRHPGEGADRQAAMLPEIAGDLRFEEVTFRYPGSTTAALDRVSFAVGTGQVIGLVGRSGSGKTTVTRLIQAVQSAQEGTVRLSGVDVRHIDLAHLRRSVGVVLQENFLFRGTIRENIAAACPDASLADVIAAARQAGADEFIDRLPLSYETPVEENGANFSGGQRQRIAIARTLMLAPRLLIFDEATSALDPESEAIIQANLREIARGRTLLIVSHRLTSLAHADSILVLDRGTLIANAPHAALLETCDVYRRLWQQQTQAMR